MGRRHGHLEKMRSKETEADYRYFREPDLLPLVLKPDGLSKSRQLPELPLARRQRFVDQLHYHYTMRRFSQQIKRYLIILRLR